MLNQDAEGATSDLYGLIRNADPETRAWLLKSFRNLLRAELREAERRARKGGKRKTYDTHGVEAYLDENIDKIADQLLNKTWKPYRSEAHIVWYPVQREIFAAQYQDRMVHHWVVDSIYPWWDRRLSHGSSSCRVGKGTQYGIKLLDKHIKRASSNFKKKVVVVKLDISGYFMHINRKFLLKNVIWGLNQQFGDDRGARYQTLKYAITQIVMDDPTLEVKIRGSYEDWQNLPEDKSLFAAKPGTGLVIGNVTSQVFSNIYLDSLDRFIRDELGYKNSGRYVDDFYVVIPLEDLDKFMERDLPAIQNILGIKSLKLNEKKIKCFTPEEGVPFLGFVNYKGKIVPDKRLRKAYHRAVQKYLHGRGSLEPVISYIGIMKNFNSWKVIKKEFKGHEKVLEEILERFEKKGNKK